MKTTHAKTGVVALILLLTLLFDSGRAQDVNTNKAPEVTISDEFSPSIQGLTEHGNLVARQVEWKSGRFEMHSLVLFDKGSGEAITAQSTNDVCFFKGKLFTADPAGPSQAAFINISQPFGTHLFDAQQVETFVYKTKPDYLFPNSPHRKRINLSPVLKEEKEHSLSAIGHPLRHAQLVVEEGKMVLLFESFTGVKGKVILDDKLNPVSMTVTGK